MERLMRPFGTKVYAHFAANDTDGSGCDGTSLLSDVRLCGAAVDAEPVASPTPVLLSHADYPKGCYEVAVDTSDFNIGTGKYVFEVGSEYAVFCSLAVDGENPTGKIAQFYLTNDGINDGRALDGTVYVPFVSNDTDGSGEDATEPLCKVRLCGAASDAAPVYAPTPTLLTHASYNDGCFEVAIPITEANGFVKDEEYAVFVTFTADGETPSMKPGLFMTFDGSDHGGGGGGPTGPGSPDDPKPHVPGVDYELCDYVYYNGQAYRCVTAHSPATENEPGVGDYWQVVWYAMGEPAGRPGIYLDPSKITFYTWSL